jgi:TPR repeat protein
VSNQAESGKRPAEVRVSELPPPSIHLARLSDLSKAALQDLIANAPGDAAGVLRAGAEAGLAEAQAVYGQMLLDGRGVKPDPAAALSWFLAAARQGHPMSMNMAGRCLDQGWGAPIDKVAAVSWFMQAAEAGLDWGMYNYASALGLGAGVARDEQAAVAWFEAAARLGHVKSINFLGGFYEEGRLKPRDRELARACYARAADGGDFRGQFNLARLLAEDGRIDETLELITLAREASPPGFRAIMAEYLRASPIPALRQAAIG